MVPSEDKARLHSPKKNQPLCKVQKLSEQTACYSCTRKHTEIITKGRCVHLQIGKSRILKCKSSNETRNKVSSLKTYFSLTSQNSLKFCLLEKIKNKRGGAAMETLKS